MLERLLEDPGIEEVRSVARRPLRRPEGGGSARLVHTRADLCEPGARRALEGVDVLYHLAAQVWQGPGASGVHAMYATNVDGTRNIVLAHPGAVVFASSVSVYGAWPDNPLPMDEAHKPRPNPECAYALHKLVSERTCAELAGRWVVLRLSAVLGPHADARVARAVRAFRLAVPAIARTDQALQWLDEADAVEGLLAAGRSIVAGGGVDGKVLNLATSDWLGASDLARLARGRVVEVPRRVLLGVSELGKRLGVTPFGADRAALIGGPLAVSVELARHRLGWQPSKTSAQVLAEALQRDWRSSPRNRLPLA